MCITTSGLCSMKRVINLKKSVEITGNILASSPQSYFGLIFRIILFLVFLIVLSVGASNVNPEQLTQRELFTAIFAFFTITLYIFYLLIIIIFTLSFQICKYGISKSTIDIIYMLLLPLIQCIIATSFEIFIFGVSQHNVNKEFYLIFLLIIILEFFISTIQFNYIYGAIAVILYNILYIILFDVAIQKEAGLEDTPANGQYVTWIIVCIIWHIVFTYIKNYINVKWFTSNKIASNVNLNILSKYTINNGAGYNGYLMDDSEGEYCSIVMGSCTDQRLGTIPVYQALHRERANVVLLLGDNIYADLAPPTITKPYAKCCKLTRVFKDEYDLLLNHKDFRPKAFSNEIQNQLWLALWDDHDYGENDAAKEYGEKVESKKAFIEFLESINDTEQVENQLASIKDDDARGLHYSYDYSMKLNSGNVNLRIIMLDTRYDRAEDETDIVGDEQWQWLRQQVNSDNDGNIDWYLICNGSPILNEGKGGKKTVGQETRNKLFEILTENDGKLLNKTILLAGDLHYSVWHSYNEQVYELTTSSITHSKQFYCCKCWYKYLTIDQYTMARDNNGFGATSKSENNCQKNSFGILKINKHKFNFCVKDAFGYSYINVLHQKK